MSWISAAIGAAGSLLGGALGNSAARHAADVSNQRYFEN